MPPSDQPPHAAAGPGTSDPGSVYQVYLRTDVRPAIRAASEQQMRGVLRTTGGHLRHHLSHDIGGFPALGPDRRHPWQACEIGSGTRAGFQLYRHVMQAVAGSCLQAMGFDPGRAAARETGATDIDLFLASASPRRMRQVLLHLAAHLEAIVADSDTAATTSADAEIPDDLWETATGVATAIQLYRHTVRAVAVHVLYYIWEGLGIGSTSPLAPFALDIADPAVFAVYPN